MPAAEGDGLCAWEGGVVSLEKVGYHAAELAQSVGWHFFAWKGDVENFGHGSSCDGAELMVSLSRLPLVMRTRAQFVVVLSIEMLALLTDW